MCGQSYAETFIQYFTRFGKGIYTSATSSKSHDYQKNSAFSQFNALLLNNVLVGRGYEIFENNENLAGPPPGYHSVGFSLTL